MKPEKNRYSLYLNSRLWKRVKAKAIEEAGAKCEICGKRGWLHVHHIHYNSFENEDNNDLAVLCPNCHDNIHYLVDKAHYYCRLFLEDPQPMSPFQFPEEFAFATLGAEMRERIDRKDRTPFIGLFIASFYGFRVRRDREYIYFSIPFPPLVDEEIYGKDFERRYEDDILMIEDFFHIDFYK